MLWYERSGIFEKGLFPVKEKRTVQIVRIRVFFFLTLSLPSESVLLFIALFFPFALSLCKEVKKKKSRKRAQIFEMQVPFFGE